MKNRRGFSILEIVFVVAILLVLRLIWVGVVGASKKSAEENRVKLIHEKMQRNLTALANAYNKVRTEKGKSIPNMTMYWSKRDRIFHETVTDKWLHNYIYFFPNACVKNFNILVVEQERIERETGVRTFPPPQIHNSNSIWAQADEDNVSHMPYSVAGRFQAYLAPKIQQVEAKIPNYGEGDPINPCPIYAIGILDPSDKLDIWKIDPGSMQITAVPVSGN